MIALYDQIQELLAELRDCDMTPDERAGAQAELSRLVTEQAEFDCAFDANQKVRQYHRVLGQIF